MHGPPLVAWLLVVLSAAAAVSCLVRDEARHEALMGVGMAVMAVPLSVLDPRPWGAPVFTAVFAAAAVHALLSARRRTGHHLHHSVCSAAMVYMALAMAGGGGGHAEHTGHAGAGTPLLTGVLLLYFAGYVLRSGTRLVALPAPGVLIPGAVGTARLRHAPEVAAACRVSMALGMFAMLMVM
ncbi:MULTISPECIES: DUF5134 domain-containing protein [unclassified Streptomyces]|uniref:DUF5134 domain-containing protein n=1 Tax=unclassified Streptomyces TaxID=2593676 RepID=UPI002E2D6133|nr:DUF5134 domain-containing protein [Streptomyces sp. NBC_00223]